MSKLDGIVFGGILGALAAVLVTPKSGEEIRQQVLEKIEELKAKPEAIKKFMDRALKLLEDGVEILGEAAAEAQKTADQKRKELGEPNALGN